MTYEEFLDIEFKINNEENYYGWIYSTRPYNEEDEEKYKYYREKQDKIIEFKKRVLTEALKNLSKDYFK